MGVAVRLCLPLSLRQARFARLEQAIADAADGSVGADESLVEKAKTLHRHQCLAVFLPSQQELHPRQCLVPAPARVVIHPASASNNDSSFYIR